MEIINIALLVIIFASMLKIENDTMTGQADLFGKIVKPQFEKETSEWINLPRIVRSGEVGSVVQRIVTGHYLDEVKGQLILYFQGNQKMSLSLGVSPEYATKYPSAKSDGVKFFQAVTNATGESLMIDPHMINRVLPDLIKKDGRNMILMLTHALLTLNNGDVVNFARWSVSWLPEALCAGIGEEE